MATHGSMEKEHAHPKYVDDHGLDSDSGHIDEFLHEFTHAEQRKIIHRVDRRLVTTVGIMYCISLMDRTNLSAAALAGMTRELRMVTGYGYSIVTLVFFISYIIFQPPATVTVRKVGPRVFLSLITLLWGSVMIGMGFVKDWGTLAGLRFILGILEAGFFPSCVYLLSTWYTRFEVGKRYSCFYVLGCVASACAGILAFGLMQLNGRAGLTGWRWIFVIEGVITCVIGIVGYWALVGFPDDAHKSFMFLNERETKMIMARVQADRGDAHTEPFALGKFMRGGKDIKIWGYALIFFGTTTISYALAYFMPIILRENMGFSIGASQCLVAPPYAFAGIVMYIVSWIGDKYHIRGPIIVFNMLLAVIGLPIMGFHKNAGVRYFGVFLVTAGANANVPATMAYQANNIRGQWKRAFCSATLVGFGGIGGIAGSLVFRTQDRPTYYPGIYACIACTIMNMIIVGLLTIRFRIQNKRADRGEVVLEDSGQGFRYTI
ncbi:hypothetical protein H2201_001443 [Coniosporium apollinis]|uniref:Major facilitator superfamily (MFS) profile domain-containing protein n=1 Tax=Coniosporium apollinis TaxID=61459 RepID=A0ABQ9P491_9PEZI|nr:hypothetical protein H2201_001443 [Coniosporium apollinis]